MPQPVNPSLDPQAYKHKYVKMFKPFKMLDQAAVKPFPRHKFNTLKP